MTFTQRTKLMLLAGFAFSLMTVTPLEGQRGRRGGRRGPPPPERAGLQQRVRVRMDEMIRERLDLTEKEWEEIGDEARGFEQERGALMRQEQALRLRVDVLILEGSEDDEEAGEILDRLITLRRQEYARAARRADQTPSWWQGWSWTGRRDGWPRPGLDSQTRRSRKPWASPEALTGRSGCFNLPYVDLLLPNTVHVSSCPNSVLRRLP